MPCLDEPTLRERQHDTRGARLLCALARAGCVAAPANDELRAAATAWLDEHHRVDLLRWTSEVIAYPDRKRPERPAMSVVLDPAFRRAVCELAGVATHASDETVLNALRFKIKDETPF